MRRVQVVSGGREGRRALNPPDLSDAAARGYSHGIVNGPGQIVHIAGQVGVGATTLEQLEVALRGVDLVCREAGGSLSDVAAMTWFTTEPVASLWQESAEVRTRLLPDPPPATTVVQVAGLADGRYRVEVAAIAVVPPESQEDLS
jgi:enamine deaminase RidA (YjgF/YER057c/UK114 family)